MCMCMCMGTKTISIMDDAYELLKKRKLRGESFSGVIRRELGKKRDIMEFAGAWSHLGDKRLNEIESNVKKLRKRFSREINDRSKKLWRNK